MKRIIIFVATIIAVLSLTVFAGCSTQPPAPPVNYDLTVSVETLNLEKGETVDVLEDLSVTNMQNATFTLTSTSSAVQISGTQITAVSAGNATITVSVNTPSGTKSATFDVVVTVQNFSVTFKNGQEVISAVTVEKGETVTAPTQAVLKVSDAQYDYAFDCWKLDGEEFDFSTPITGNIELEASFSATVRKYAVTFKNEDGQVVSSSNVAWGSAIALPTAPTKEPTAEYTYAFAGWTGYTEGMTVSGNVEFTASFTPSIRKYTVTFVDEYGLVVSTLSVDYNSLATAPIQDLEKVSDVQYDYTFDCWKLDGEEFDFSTPITGNIKLEASFSATVRKYTITFLDKDGNLFESMEQEYGSVIVLPLTTPTPPPCTVPNMANVFKRWKNTVTNANYKEGALVTGDISFKPYYLTEEQIATFTGFVVNENGNKIDAKVYLDGVEYADATASGGFELKNLVFGEHTVRFVNKNYLEREITLLSAKEANKNFDVVLNRPLFSYGDEIEFGYEASATNQHASETYSYSKFTGEYTFAPENLVLDTVSVVKFSLTFNNGCCYTSNGNFVYNNDKANLNLKFTVQGGEIGSKGYVSKVYGMGINNKGNLYTETGTPATSDNGSIINLGESFEAGNYDHKIYFAYVRNNQDVWMYAKTNDDDYKLISSLSDDFPAEESRQIKLCFSQNMIEKFLLDFTLSDFEIITDEEEVMKYASRNIQIEYDADKVDVSQTGIKIPGKAMGNENSVTVFVRPKVGYYVVGVFDAEGNSVANPVAGAFSILIDLTVIKEYGPYYVRVEEFLGDIFTLKGTIIAEDGNNEGILVSIGTSATYTDANGYYSLSVPCGISFEGMPIVFEKEGYHTYVKAISYALKQKLDNAQADDVIENTEPYKQLQRVMIRPEGFGPYENSSVNVVSYDYEKGSEKIDVTSGPRSNIFFRDVYAPNIMLKTRFTIKSTTDPDPRVGVRFMNAEGKGIRILLWQEGFDTKLADGWNSENGTSSKNSIAGSGVDMRVTGVTYDMIVVKKGNTIEIYAKHFLSEEYLLVGRENTAICAGAVYVSLDHNCINEYRLITFENIEISYGDTKDCIPEEYR